MEQSDKESYGDRVKGQRESRSCDRLRSGPDEAMKR